jgi:uncharacterized protein YdhG (YjbR/CyaY superfamily)
MPSPIDAYISAQPLALQTKLRQIKLIIKKQAPLATEDIKYGMPTFVDNGNLVHFAACQKHLGFYPTPSAIVRFKKELDGYHCSKGAVQFPWERPLPSALIAKMVKFRVRENQENNNYKKTKIQNLN